jgi:hypothetical protein
MSYLKFFKNQCVMRTVDGDPCALPAANGEKFCAYHKTNGTVPVAFVDPTSSFEHAYLPELKDAAAIQAAISEVSELMLHRRIEPKEATALFYAMQVASFNLGLLNPIPENDYPRALPPGIIHGCAERKPKRRRGRPRKVVAEAGA